MAKKIYKYHRAKRENAEAFKIVATYCIEKGLKTIFEVLDDSKTINVEFKEEELKQLVSKENNELNEEKPYEIDEEMIREVASQRVESRINTSIVDMAKGGKNFVPGFLDKIANSIVSAEEFGQNVETETKIENKKETIVLYNTPKKKKEKRKKKRRIYASIK